ncbi:MAG: hypothetical protein IJZ14_02075 [Oscillospiraceae bacterium]|nr:hypothetical protein [Oscillospiraceae bacterium]
MRKALAAILAALFTLLLCACGGTEAIPTDNQAPTSSQVDIVTTASNEATANYETTTTTPVTTEATTEDTTPVHTHSFSSATCTKPATCSCGETQGSANGHSFSDGVCVACGAADPDYEQSANVWIPTNGGKKYHKSASCSNMKNPERVTQSEAESRGFTPCKRCY